MTGQRPAKLLYDQFAKWAIESPGKIAIIEYESGKQLMHRQLLRLVDTAAYRLLEMGISYADRIATTMPFSADYVILMLASFKIGAIFSPIDGKQSTNTLIHQLARIQPKVLAFSKELTQEQYSHIRSNCTFIRTYLQDDQKFEHPQVCLHPFSYLYRPSRLSYKFLRRRFAYRLRKNTKDLHLWSPALTLFKENENNQAVLLSHENLIQQYRLCQHLYGLRQEAKVLVNLPAHHIGGLSMSLLASLFSGSTAVLCADIQTSLAAMQEHYITHLIQFSECYLQMWEKIDLDHYFDNSLQFATYIGGQPDLTFLNNMQSFTPDSGTGLCLLESGGLISFTPTHYSIDTFSQHLGMEIPQFSKFSIREPMDSENYAGDPLPEGSEGEICIHPPTVFLGYYGDLPSTSKVLSKEGILYTGYQGKLFTHQYQRLLCIVQPPEKQASIKQEITSLVSV